MSSTTTPSTAELAEGLLFYPIALVISSTIFPGFTLVIPALLFVTVPLLLPFVALAIVGLVAAAVVAAPVMLVRGIRALLERRAESRRMPQVPQPV